MDPLRRAIEQRAFTQDERAVINERLGRVQDLLTEYDDQQIAEAAERDLAVLRTLRNMPRRSSGRTTRTAPVVLPMEMTETLRRDRT